MDMKALMNAVADVKPVEDETCELLEGAALEACSGGKVPWVKWGMAFSTTNEN